MPCVSAPLTVRYREGCKRYFSTRLVKAAALRYNTTRTAPHRSTRHAPGYAEQGSSGPPEPHVQDRTGLPTRCCMGWQPGTAAWGGSGRLGTLHRLAGRLVGGAARASAPPGCHHEPTTTAFRSARAQRAAIDQRTGSKCTGQRTQATRHAHHALTRSHSSSDSVPYLPAHPTPTSILRPRAPPYNPPIPPIPRCVPLISRCPSPRRRRRPRPPRWPRPRAAARSRLRY